MSAAGDPAPPPEATFESLEAELEQVTGRLEDASVPLEERLQLHARAAAMHRRLEALVETARQDTAEPGKNAAPEGQDAAEPYEKVRDRLGAVVNALDADDLPLARVVELHREAQRLAARCEAILDGAQEAIRQAAAGAGGSGTDPDSDVPD
ncbi:MAG: exodeoxyribonuclease VII small subunit [Acidobacteria bacterium]|nr:exodeoxyribonuclease VII small subunit [Acidobacteriota bacterium]MYE44527.1 exodeoxyribonuclease VII small subunit [Acidobacteriota bacterium]